MSAEGNLPAARRGNAPRRGAALALALVAALAAVGAGRLRQRAAVHRDRQRDGAGRRARRAGRLEGRCAARLVPGAVDRKDARGRAKRVRRCRPGRSGRRDRLDAATAPGSPSSSTATSCACSTPTDACPGRPVAIIDPDAIPVEPHRPRRDVLRQRRRHDLRRLPARSLGCKPGVLAIKTLAGTVRLKSAARTVASRRACIATRS